MIIVIDPAVTEPVTLAEAKLHCRVDSDEEDSLIAIYISAARAIAEHRTGRVFVTQTLELVLDCFPCNEIELSNVPVSSITSVKYLDLNGVQQTISNTDYALDNAGLKNWVIPAHGKTWPNSYDSANAVRVRYVSGYGDVTKVPGGLKSWMLLAIGTLYKNRETSLDAQQYSLPEQFYDSLLDPFKTWTM